MRFRVLAIDEDVRMLHVLRISLNARGYETDIATTGQEGLAVAAKFPPDLVITGLDLPDMAGVELITTLRRWSQAPIIALSGSTSSKDKVDALDAGADDYLCVPFDTDELLARLRAASRRASQAGDVTSIRIGACTVDIAGRHVAGAEGEVKLTPTEWQVLEALVRRAGRLVTPAQLLAELPGKARLLDSSFLRLHLMHLRQKLEDNPAFPRHLVTEPGMGYRFMP